MSGVPVRDFLKARRDRALGTILGHVESHFKDKLSPSEWSAFRLNTIDAINGYHDSVLDLVKSENGYLRNEEAIELLERIERLVAR